MKLVGCWNDNPHKYALILVVFMSYASRFILTSIEDIKTVSNAVVSGVDRYTDLSEERRFDIALVINELLANSFEHATPSSRNPVVLAADLCGKSLHIGIRDGGEGFEVEETLERLTRPIDDNDLYRERGRGLRLVQALCQEMNFGERGNSVEVKIEL